MHKAFSHILGPLHRLTLRQVMLILIPALSIICWAALLLVLYKQFVAIGFSRYVGAQQRLIDTFVRTNVTSLKLHDLGEVRRNMASLEFGTEDSAVAIIDRSGEYILGTIDNTQRDFNLINAWIKGHDLKINLSGNRYSFGNKDFFVFQQPIIDPYDASYLGTVLSFVHDRAFAMQESSARNTLLMVGLGLLVIQTAIILLIINTIVAPVEAISRTASAHRDMAELSKDLSSLKASHAVYTKDLSILSESLAETMAQNAVNVTLGRLAAQLAHDMRSPLSVLKSFASASADLPGTEDAADRQAFKDAALRSVARLNGMANELLNYSRSQTIQRTNTNLASIIRGVLDDTKHTTENKDIAFIYDGADALTAQLDEMKISRVLTNMVINGIQAISEAGTITISAENDAADTLVITIRDTGTGIDPQHLPRIFDQSFTYGKKGGLGLGLAFCHNVITAHGGRISVESTPGVGTSFIIRIPSTHT